MNGDYSATSADSFITSTWSIPYGCYDYTNNIYRTVTDISDSLINMAHKETENNTPDELKINIKKNKVELNFKL